MYILVGDHDYTTKYDTPYPTIYQVQEIKKHQNYVPDSTSQNYDIALVKTFDAMKWKKTIGPACLPFIYQGSNLLSYFDGYALVGNSRN